MHSLNVKQTHSYLDVYNSDEDEDANYCDGDDDGDDVAENASENASEGTSEEISEDADKPSDSFVCWRQAFLLMKRWNNGQEPNSSPYGHSSRGLQRSSSA